VKCLVASAVMAALGLGLRQGGRLIDGLLAAKLLLAWP
jgi:hypothetical protein